MMLVAGGVIYLNTIESSGRPYITLDSEEATLQIARGHTAYYMSRGWPLIFWERYNNPFSPQFDDEPLLRHRVLEIVPLLINLIIMLALLAATWVGCEHLSRRARQRTPGN